MKFVTLLATAAVTVIVSASSSLKDSSFESSSSSKSWTDLSRGTSEVQAAPDGSGFAKIRGGNQIKQKSTMIIEENKSYKLTTWSRSIDGDSQRGTELSTTATVSLATEDGTKLAMFSTSVNPPTLSGEAATRYNDDGANVWLQDGVRMHAGNRLMSQLVSADPLTSPWTSGEEVEGMATGIYLNKEETKAEALYQTFYITDHKKLPTTSRIDAVKLSGRVPNIKMAKPTGEDAAGKVYDTILSHVGNEDPWAIDAHVFRDPDTDKLWMTWGGHSLWISELDPDTGRLLGDPQSTEFDTHSKSAHTCIATFEAGALCPGVTGNPHEGWEGDDFGTSYVEGPSLYKREGKYFLCGSYGSMDDDYTIRCCRSNTPKGPYYDKDGIGCTHFSKNKDRYGASILLGDDGRHLVPAHPHIWAESDGKEYLGYDFRPGKTNADDVMGIRRLYWVNGWPTIWTPLEVTLSAKDVPRSALGSRLTVELGNAGHSKSLAAFDMVELTSVDVDDDDDGNDDGDDDRITTEAPVEAPSVCAGLSKRGCKKNNLCIWVGKRTCMAKENAVCEDINKRKTCRALECDWKGKRVGCV